MEHVNRKKLETLILFIDFQKALNSLSYKYIDECNREA